MLKRAFENPQLTNSVMIHSSSNEHLQQVDKVRGDFAGWVKPHSFRSRSPADQRSFSSLESASMSVNSFADKNKSIEKALLASSNHITSLNECMDVAIVSADLRMLSGCFSLLVWYRAMDGKGLSDYVDQSEFYEMIKCDVKETEESLRLALEYLEIPHSDFEAIMNVPFDGSFSIGSYELSKENIIKGLEAQFSDVSKLSAAYQPYLSCVNAVCKHRCHII